VFSKELLGKININLASTSELEGLPGIGEVKAQAIIDFRERYGNFLDINELLYVPGISPGLLETIEPFIEIR
jgi:competence protein ComEA